MPAYTDEIQPTMVRTVALIRSFGLETTDSGDGVLNVEAGMEAALDFPHVIVMLDSAVFIDTTARRLASKLGAFVRPETEFHVEVSYSTKDDLAIATIIGLTDAGLREPGDHPPILDSFSRSFLERMHVFADEGYEGAPNPSLLRLERQGWVERDPQTTGKVTRWRITDEGSDAYAGRTVVLPDSDKVALTTTILDQLAELSSAEEKT